MKKYNENDDLNDPLFAAINKAEMDPPAGLWESVEREMAAKGRRRKLKRFVCLSAAACIGGIILMSGLVTKGEIFETTFNFIKEEIKSLPVINNVIRNYSYLIAPDETVASDTCRTEEFCDFTLIKKYMTENFQIPVEDVEKLIVMYKSPVVSEEDIKTVKEYKKKYKVLSVLDFLKPNKNKTKENITAVNNIPVKKEIEKGKTATGKTEIIKTQKTKAPKVKNAGNAAAKKEVEKTATATVYNKVKETVIKKDAGKIKQKKEDEAQNAGKTVTEKTETAAETKTTAPLNETENNKNTGSLISAKVDSVKTEAPETAINTAIPDGAKQIPNNEIHTGVVYSFNSVWILNQNNYGQFNGSELSYKFGAGSAYGVVVGYDIKRRYGVETGIIIKSAEGQKYHDELYTGEVNRRIELEYIHIPAYFRMKSYLNNKSLPVILNIAAGVQYGILKSAKETVNGNESDIKNRFKKNELSLTIKLGSDVYLNNHLYFTFGLNTGISGNINDKDWLVNGKYRYSHNFIFGADVGISYYLQSK